MNSVGGPTGLRSRGACRTSSNPGKYPSHGPSSLKAGGGAEQEPRLFYPHDQPAKGCNNSIPCEPLFVQSGMRGQSEILHEEVCATTGFDKVARKGSPAGKNRAKNGLCLLR